MSTIDDDIELRELVAQNLENNGCLAKIRAQLRASTFLCVEDDIKLNKLEPYNNLKIKSYLETSEGRSLFYIVREFLEFFNLQFTISVYDTEAYLDHLNRHETREETVKQLNLNNEEPTVPLLENLFKIAQTKAKVLDINLNLDNNENSFDDESSNNQSSCTKTGSENNYSKESFNSNTNSNCKQASATNDLKQNVNEAVCNRSNQENTSANKEYTASIEINVETLKNTKNIDQNRTYTVSNTDDDVSLTSKSIKCSDNNSITTNNTMPTNKINLSSTIGSDFEFANSPDQTNNNNISHTSTPNFNNLIETNIDNDSCKSINFNTSETDKSQRSLKTKCNLNSLSDLPPLNLNKVQHTDDSFASFYKGKSMIKQLDTFDLSCNENFSDKNDETGNAKRAEREEV